MLNIFADALLIAMRMHPLHGHHGPSRALPEGDNNDRREDPPRRFFTLMGLKR